MNSLSSLLSFEDLRQTLFAESRDFAQVQTPAYGIAVQGKVAQLEEAVAGLTREAVTGGVAITHPAVINLNADYLGNILNDPFPILVNVEITLFSIDIVDDPRTEVVFTPIGCYGEETTQGTYRIDGVTTAFPKLRYSVSFAGVPQGSWTLNINVLKADPPPPLPPVVTPPSTPTPPSAIVTAAHSFALDAVSQPAYALVATTALNGGFAYRFTLESALVQADNASKDSNISVYIAVRLGSGPWEPIGAIETALPITHTIDAEPGYNTRPSVERYQEPGYINMLRSVVIPSGTHTLGVFAKLEYGETVQFLSKAVVEPG